MNSLRACAPNCVVWQFLFEEILEMQLSSIRDPDEVGLSAPSQEDVLPDLYRAFGALGRQ